MRAENGGSAAALTADGKEREGKFNTRPESQIDPLLGKDALTFKTAYRITASGNWQSRKILGRLTTLEDRPQEQKPAFRRQGGPARTTVVSTIRRHPTITLGQLHLHVPCRSGFI